MTHADAKRANDHAVPNISRSPAGPPHPATLYLGNALTPELLALIQRAAAEGAQITIVTVHRQPERRAPDTDAPPLTTDQAAAHYRVEPATIRAWCREGRFPGATRTGKSWRIPTPTNTRRPSAATSPPPDSPSPDIPQAQPRQAHPQPPTAGDGAPPTTASPPRTQAQRAARRTPNDAAPRPQHPPFDPADLGAWRTHDHNTRS